eukprot:1195404-Prorocentrum_minimum.AAC.3
MPALRTAGRGTDRLVGGKSGNGLLLVRFWRGRWLHGGRGGCGGCGGRGRLGGNNLGGNKLGVGGNNLGGNNLGVGGSNGLLWTAFHIPRSRRPISCRIPSRRERPWRATANLGDTFGRDSGWMPTCYKRGVDATRVPYLGPPGRFVSLLEQASEEAGREGDPQGGPRADDARGHQPPVHQLPHVLHLLAHLGAVPQPSGVVLAVVLQQAAWGNGGQEGVRRGSEGGQNINVGRYRGKYGNCDARTANI